MEVSFRRWFMTCLLTILMLIGSCASAKPVEDAASRVSVSFIAPEKFTDARRAELEPTSSGVLHELERFLIDTAAPYHRRI